VTSGSGSAGVFEKLHIFNTVGDYLYSTFIYHLQPFLALGEEFIAPVTCNGMPGEGNSRIIGETAITKPISNFVKVRRSFKSEHDVSAILQTVSTYA